MANYEIDNEENSKRIPVPDRFFTFIRPAEKGHNSLYRCLKCPPGFNKKELSCSDTSRLNLKKHVEVGT